jgi:hypothetical protein
VRMRSFSNKKASSSSFFVLLGLCSMDYDRCSTQGGNDADHDDDDYYSSFSRSLARSLPMCTPLTSDWTASLLNIIHDMSPIISTIVLDWNSARMCVCVRARVHAPEPVKSRENLTCVMKELCTSSIVRKPE